MPYWRLFYHIVWATKHRLPLISPEVEAVTYPVIAEKARELGVIVYALNGIEDHVDIAVAARPNLAPATIVGQLKGRSSRVASRHFGSEFKWQTGYGVHSFGEKHLPWVVEYIERQKEHHAERTVVAQLEVLSDDDNGPSGVSAD